MTQRKTSGWPSGRRSAAPTRCATRSSSPRTAPALPASPTGQNSSSPNPPGSSAPACCRLSPDRSRRKLHSALPTSWSSASSPRMRTSSSARTSCCRGRAPHPDDGVGVGHRRGRPAARHQPLRPARRRGREGRRPRLARRPAGTDAGELHRRRHRGSWRRLAWRAGTAAEAVSALLDDPAPTAT